MPQDECDDDNDSFVASWAGDAFLSSNARDGVARARARVAGPDHNQSMPQRRSSRRAVGDRPGYVRPVDIDPSNPKSRERYMVKDKRFYRKDGPIWTDPHHTPPERKHLINYRPDLDAWHDSQVQRRIQAELLEQAKHVRYEYQRYHHLRRRTTNKQSNAEAIQPGSRPSSARPSRRTTTILTPQQHGSEGEQKSVDAFDTLLNKPCKGRGRHHHRETYTGGFRKAWRYSESNDDFADKFSEIPKDRVRLLISPRDLQSDKRAIERIAQRRKDDIQSELKQRQRRQQRARAIREFFGRQSRANASWLRSLGLPPPRCLSASARRRTSSEERTSERASAPAVPRQVAVDGHHKEINRTTLKATRKAMRPSSAPPKRPSDAITVQNTHMSASSNYTRPSPRTYSPQRLQQLAKPRLRTQVQEIDPLQTSDCVGMLLHPRALGPEAVDLFSPQHVVEATATQPEKCEPESSEQRARRYSSRKPGSTSICRVDVVPRSSRRKHRTGGSKHRRGGRHSRSRQKKSDSELVCPKPMLTQDREGEQGEEVDYRLERVRQPRVQSARASKRDTSTQRSVHCGGQLVGRSMRPSSGSPATTRQGWISDESIDPNEGHVSVGVREGKEDIGLSGMHCGRQPSAHSMRPSSGYPATTPQGWISDESIDPNEIHTSIGGREGKEEDGASMMLKSRRNNPAESKSMSDDRHETLNELDEFESRLLQLELDKAEADKRRPRPPAFYMRCVREGHYDEVTI